ncbi:MAG: cation transporter, partial [Hyphomicrobiales bacterium]
MTCHARKSTAQTPKTAAAAPPALAEADYALWTRSSAPGRMHIDLLVDGMHCAGCIKRVEAALNAHKGVISSRVNMSTKRVAVDWHEGEAEPGDLARTVAKLGFEVRPFDAGRGADHADRDRGRE